MRVATYISEQKTKILAAVVAFAHDNVVMHRGSFGEPRPGNSNRDSGAAGKVELFGQHGKTFQVEGKGSSNLHDPK